MPGFNWGVEALMKYAVPDSWSDDQGWRGSIFAYTFAYGDRFSMIPNNYQRIFWGVAGKFGGLPSDVLQATTEDVIRDAALQGITVVRTERPSGENEISYQDAEAIAENWLIYRGFIGTFLPTYPLVNREADEARAAYHDWYDELGSYDAADRMWSSRSTGTDTTPSSRSSGHGSRSGGLICPSPRA